ncbi:MAG: HIT family protein [Acidobacteria bacterium]|nr:MAG: HIT family protein [Acidobacteriota bacterium]
MPAHNPNEPCRFCLIAHGQDLSHTVFEDQYSLAFLDYRPLFPGHTLLIPKQHYETLLDVPSALIEPLFTNVQLIARALEVGLGAQGSFIAINNRVSQSVPHLHIHIVPRRRKDGLKGFFWPRQRYKDEREMVEVREKLRRAIRSLKRHRTPHHG